MILHSASFPSRVLALALLGAVVAGLYLLVARPVTEQHQRYRDSIAQSQSLLGQYRRLGASLPALQSQIAELDRRRNAAGTHLRGASDALVAAELQTRVKLAVESHGGRLTSTQILAAKDESELRRIGMRVQMTATIEVLHQIFYQLESSKPLIFLDNIDIRTRRAARPRRRRSGSTPADVAATPAENEPNLNFRFDIYGYMRVEAT